MSLSKRNYNKAIKILNYGRQFRINQIKKWKEEIPSIKELVKNNEILLENWFIKNIKLINFGARQFDLIKKQDNKIKLIYTNYANSKKKVFINYLPIKIKIDNDFQYFFGLWCGDRLGSGRFGVANKNKGLLCSCWNKK